MEVQMARMPSPASAAKLPNGRRNTINIGSDLATTAVVAQRWRVLDQARKSCLFPQNKFRERWDVAMIVLLIFTATVTPFEVAFLDGDVNVLFAINRVVDMAFIIDLIFNFLTPYRGSAAEGREWVISKKEISKKYLKTWFIVDFLSVLPLDLIGIVASIDTLSRLRIIRVLRLLKLLKLFRVLRAMRILKRFETKVAINYQLLLLVKFLVGIVFISHWVACIFTFAGDYDSLVRNGTVGDVEANSSVSARLLSPGDIRFESSWIVEQGLEDKGSFAVYTASLYWAVMTLSTIGYGDIIPISYTEHIVAVMVMLMGASLWAYIVGKVCGIVQELDKHTTHFRMLMDDLNYFMASRNLDPDLQRRVREFFHQARRMRRIDEYRVVLDRLSPQLQNNVSYEVNNGWIRRVPYFRPLDKPEHRACLASIAKHLVPVVYIPEEVITGSYLHIVVRGVAVEHGSGLLYWSGRVWGEKMVLETLSPDDFPSIKALTYVDAFYLTKEALLLSLEEFPTQETMIRRYALMLSFLFRVKKIRRLPLEQQAAEIEKMRSPQQRGAQRPVEASDSIGSETSGSEGAQVFGRCSIDNDLVTLTKSDLTALMQRISARVSNDCVLPASFVSSLVSPQAIAYMNSQRE